MYTQIFTCKQPQWYKHIHMISNIGVHIKVAYFAKSKKFYEDLGFKKVFEYGPTCEVKEEYSGIVFQHGNTKLEIADGHRAVKKVVFAEKVTSSKISLMIGVDRLSDFISLCKLNGIALAVEPRHYYWGTLEAVVKDPDGTVLVFIAPYDQKEAKLIKAKTITIN